MNDKEKLEQLLQSFGLKMGRFENNCDVVDGDFASEEALLKISEGGGYDSYCCKFWFDKNGKFESWEVES